MRMLDPISRKAVDTGSTARRTLFRPFMARSLAFVLGILPGPRFEFQGAMSRATIRTVQDAAHPGSDVCADDSGADHDLDSAGRKLSDRIERSRSRSRDRRHLRGHRGPREAHTPGSVHSDPAGARPGPGHHFLRAVDRRRPGRGPRNRCDRRPARLDDPSLRQRAALPDCRGRIHLLLWFGHHRHGGRVCSPGRASDRAVSRDADGHGGGHRHCGGGLWYRLWRGDHQPLHSGHCAERGRTAADFGHRLSYRLVPALCADRRASCLVLCTARPGRSFQQPGRGHSRGPAARACRPARVQSHARNGPWRRLCFAPGHGVGCHPEGLVPERTQCPVRRRRHPDRNHRSLELRPGRDRIQQRGFGTRCDGPAPC